MPLAPTGTLAQSSTTNSSTAQASAASPRTAAPATDERVMNALLAIAGSGPDASLLGSEPGGLQLVGEGHPVGQEGPGVAGVDDLLHPEGLRRAERAADRVQPGLDLPVE